MADQITRYWRPSPFQRTVARQFNDLSPESLTVQSNTTMKNKLQHIAAALLGLAFLTFGLNFFLNFLPMPDPPEGSLVIPFFQATGSSGFMTFVKVCEILGAVLVVVPRTRNWGLLILGPIVINIIAFNIFVAGGTSVLQPPVIAVSVLAAYLLWAGREKFLALLNS